MSTTGQLIGGAVMLVTLADIFLTVLYARVGRGSVKRLGAGFISVWVAHATWETFRKIPLQHRLRDEVLSFAGPVILVLLLASWTALLTLGDALVVWPALGNQIRSTAEPTPTGFLSAVYAAGTSLAIAGSTDFVPRTDGYRLFSVLSSFIGTAAATLTLTYLLQLYGALQRKNALGQELFFLTHETGDAAELIAGLGLHAQPGAAYSELSAAAHTLSSVNESLQIYPIAFYFRYPNPHYSLAAIACVSLDTVSLLRACLKDDAHGWVKESGAVELLWRSAMSLLVTLDGAYLHTRIAPEGELDEIGDDARAAWKERYRRAAGKLRHRGLSATENDTQADAYVRHRAVWDGLLDAMAQYSAFDMASIDGSMRAAK